MTAEANHFPLSLAAAEPAKRTEHDHQCEGFAR
jgi:hypothetical protein